MSHAFPILNLILIHKLSILFILSFSIQSYFFKQNLKRLEVKTSPLQIRLSSDRERTNIYQTYTIESVAVIHQQKKIVSPTTASLCNDLAPRKTTAIKTWNALQKKQILLPNYIDLLRQNRKRMYEMCTIHQSCPGLEKTEINGTTSLDHSPNKKYLRVRLRVNPIVWKSGGM